MTEITDPDPDTCYHCDEPGELHAHGKGDVCSDCCDMLYQGLCS